MPARPADLCKLPSLKLLPCPRQVRGKTVYLQYSTRQEIVNSTRSVEQGGNVLLVSLENLLVGSSYISRYSQISDRAHTDAASMQDLSHAQLRLSRSSFVTAGGHAIFHAEHMGNVGDRPCSPFEASPLCCAA